MKKIPHRLLLAYYDAPDYSFAMSEFIGYSFVFAFLGVCVGGFLDGFLHAGRTTRAKKRGYPS